MHSVALTIVLYAGGLALIQPTQSCARTRPGPSSRPSVISDEQKGFYLHCVMSYNTLELALQVSDLPEGVMDSLKPLVVKYLDEVHLERSRLGERVPAPSEWKDRADEMRQQWEAKSLAPWMEAHPDAAKTITQKGEVLDRVVVLLLQRPDSLARIAREAGLEGQAADSFANSIRESHDAVVKRTSDVQHAKGETPRLEAQMEFLRQAKQLYQNLREPLDADHRALLDSLILKDG